jgi:hypothetical protein
MKAEYARLSLHGAGSADGRGATIRFDSAPVRGSAVVEAPGVPDRFSSPSTTMSGQMSIPGANGRH